MKIVNDVYEDNHIHSLNFSDGFNTIDEIVIAADKFGLKKITITDHSQHKIDHDGLGQKTYRSIVKRWHNVHNGVEVQFGIEADIIDHRGKTCFEIDHHESDFNILSVHKDGYEGDLEKIDEAYRIAIEKNYKRINCIGHPCSKWFSKHLGMDKLVELCNKYKIPMEFNCADLENDKTDLDLQKRMLEKVDLVMVNSDAHTLWELKEVRNKGFDFLSNGS